MRRNLSKLFAACMMSFLVLATTGTSTHAQEKAESAQAAIGWKTLHYLDVPLKLTVRTGEESVLRFPWAVKPGISSEIVGMLHEPRIVGDTFYLTPASPFHFERFMFLSPDTGAIILIDIRSTENALPVRVIVNDSRAVDAATEMKSEFSNRAPASDKQRVGARPYTVIDLAQYAMQVVYAPPSEIRPMPGLTEITVRNPPVVNDLVPGALVDTVQWKEWRTVDGRYLTALVVQNRGSSQVSLDPTLRRHSRYEIASSPYSSNLAPYGMPGDKTTLVIISSESWNDAITLSRR